MKLLPKPHASQRRLIEILRVINASDKPIGARAISDELSNRGYDVGERAVRYNLKIMDELGFTKKEGYSGRTLTSLGRRELSDALVDDRIGFVNTRIEEYMYRSSFDPDSGVKADWKADGKMVVVNESLLHKRDYELALETMIRVFDAGFAVSRRVLIQDEGEEMGTVSIPRGFLGISTVCSITVDGMLLSRGIPVNTTFAGFVEVKDGDLSEFTDLIAYAGSSLDPMRVFISRKTSRVSEAATTGSGSILANLREIPVAAVDEVRDLLDRAKGAGIGGLMRMSGPGEPNMGCPVGAGKMGLALCGGVNAVVAAEELGAEITTMPISSLQDYGRMRELR
ncbi:NrpR regulatory domain-containing protein [Methanotrichaceae archaeon M04Ac]|uniref:NrpR regulatory domain-containing protein n=1 Tax=Candidatus Methanocrinis alkalitolerans TaxID=3033395 RepID=A0ABT5XD38_9EURY|nr:NrpR regulatory domain-containing protein [Candidatus Methanocrinis alkalitolerans]MDF0592620.1 NrpR regulatory domain-containing protein [Candidatus Methanocrinis alkalitolerans]